MREQSARYRPSNSNLEAMTQHLKHSRKEKGKRRQDPVRNNRRFQPGKSSDQPEEDGSRREPQRRASGTRGAERSAAQRPPPRSAAPIPAAHNKGRPASPRAANDGIYMEYPNESGSHAGIRRCRRQERKKDKIKPKNPKEPREALRPRTKGRGAGPLQDPSAAQRAALPGPAPRGGGAAENGHLPSARRGRPARHKGSLCAGPAPRRRPRRPEPGRRPPFPRPPPGIGRCPGRALRPTCAAPLTAAPRSSRRPPALSTAPLRPPPAARL